MVNPLVDPLVDIQQLKVAFTGNKQRPVQAVNGVDLRLAKGQTVALIGESGSGKSVMLRSLLNLHPKKRTRISGNVSVAGWDVLNLKGRQLANYRGAVAAMIFQEPLLALDPVYTIGQQITEAIRRHERISRAEATERALMQLERVHMPNPKRRLQTYPHEMSGGMRQRAMIALALACNPQLLLADEPTTALDATVQIQILLLLRELQRDLGLTIIFVTHDIGAAVEVADSMAVMYAGRIVEFASTRDIIHNPHHPYTQALLVSRVHDNPKPGERLATIPGAPPDLADLPAGCAFAPRCSFASKQCHEEQPAMTVVGEKHHVHCFHSDAVAAVNPDITSASKTISSI